MHSFSLVRKRHGPDFQQQPFCLELTAGLNHDLGAGGAAATSHAFNGTDNVHALNNGSKDRVLSIEPRGFGGTQEKLRAVRVGAGIRHGQNTRTRVLQRKVLIGELVSVDRLATRSLRIQRKEKHKHVRLDT